MTTERRLAKLERENRIMRAAGVLALLIGASILLIGAGQDEAKVHTELRTNKLLLVDAEGKTRAVLEQSKEGHGLRFFAADGRPIMGLGCAINGQGGLGISTPDRKAEARLEIDSDGSPGLHITNNSTKSAISISAEEKHAAVKIGNPELIAGPGSACLGISTSGDAFMYLSNRSNYTVIQLDAKPKKATVMLGDPRGEKTVQPGK